MKSKNALIILAILCLMIVLKGLIIGSTGVVIAGMVGVVINYGLSLD